MRAQENSCTLSLLRNGGCVLEVVLGFRDRLEMAAFRDARFGFYGFGQKVKLIAGKRGQVAVSGSSPTPGRETGTAIFLLDTAQDLPEGVDVAFATRPADSPMPPRPAAPVIVGPGDITISSQATRISVAGNRHMTVASPRVELEGTVRPGETLVVGDATGSIRMIGWDGRSIGEMRGRLKDLTVTADLDAAFRLGGFAQYTWTDPKSTVDVSDLRTMRELPLEQLPPLYDLRDTFENDI